MIHLRWDVPALIDALGGASQFAQECTVRGYGPVKPKAVRKWLERDSIPPHGLAAAALVLGARGQRLTTFIDNPNPVTGRLPN